MRITSREIRRVAAIHAASVRAASEAEQRQPLDDGSDALSVAFGTLTARHEKHDAFSLVAMTNLAALAQRVQRLEDRVRQLERKARSPKLQQRS